MRNYILPALLFIFSLRAEAQKKIIPGDQSLRYDLIKPGAEKYRVIITDSTGRLLNESTIINMYSVDPSKNQFTKTQFRMAGPKTVLVDSTIAELSTLKPIHMSMTTTPVMMLMDLQFNGMNVRARIERGGKKSDTTHVMSSPYFDSNLLEYLIGLIPYKTGEQYSLNMYTFEKDGDDPCTIKCVGEENVTDSRNNSVPCYSLEISSGGMGAAKVQYWVDKNTGSSVKTIFKVPGRTFTMLRD